MEQPWRLPVWASRPRDELLQQGEQSVLREGQLSAPVLLVALVPEALLEQVFQPGPVPGEQPREQRAARPQEAVPVPQEEQPQLEPEAQLQREAAGEQPQTVSCALLWRLLPSLLFPRRRFAPR
jgi:hypothetical protein